MNEYAGKDEPLTILVGNNFGLVKFGVAVSSRQAGAFRVLSERIGEIHLLQRRRRSGPERTSILKLLLVILPTLLLPT